MKLPIPLIFLFTTVQRCIWTQYLSCPAQDWTLDSTITLKCYLPREDVPFKCTGGFSDRVTFKRQPFTGSGSTRCTVNDVTTTSCTPSSSECGCQPASATYFMVHHTFTVDADDDGTWQCSVACLNDHFVPAMPISRDNCDDRKVVAHAVLSTPTITVTTPDTGSGWTVRGTVDIARIFSSTGDYSCMWSYRRDSGQYTDITSSTITTDPPASGTSVRTGQCGFPDRPLPSDPGTYTYRVTVSPGQTVKTDSVVIETPVISSRNCNPITGYVVENGEVTCTCNANVGRPAGRLRWFMESTTGTTAIEDGQYGDGTLTVRQTVDRNHHGNKLRCKVDWITDITGPDFTLRVAYPPQSPPLISRYVNNQILYQGDRLTLTCTVTGGDPVVHSVSLTCPGQHEQNPSNGQSSSLVISSLSDSDNNLVCVCRGHWVRESYYTLTDSRTLTVYYPPSSPVISRTDGQSYPPLEGDIVTLTCSLTSPGHPSAGITWPSEGPAVNTNPLQLSVDRGDNQRDVTCQASNEFTQQKGLELRDDFTLQVYYEPVISLRPADDNRCVMTSDRTSCHVTEGRRVHLLCDVDSNPDPQDCVWSASHVTGPDLDIVSVSRTHSGVYQIQVETTKPDISDGRLPLRAHSSLTVLVKYPPTQTTLLGNTDVSVIVNETEAVTLECQSRGRPTPSLDLLQRGVVLASKDGGQLSLSEEMSRLVYSFTVRCSNTGTFTCRADNGVGNDQQTSVQLTVHCKPRSSSADPVIPTVNFIDKPVSVAFTLEALPLPDRHRFQYLGNAQTSDRSQPVPNSIELSVTCTNTYAVYAVMCNATVDRVKDSSAEGFYIYTAANAFGEERLVFRVTLRASKEHPEEESSVNTAAIALGVTLAVAFVIFLTFIICVWCRGWILPCASDGRGQVRQETRQRKELNTERPPLESAGPPVSEEFELTEGGSRRHAGENQSPSPYASLQTSDIGVSSVYSEISHRSDTSSAVHQGPVDKNNGGQKQA